MAPRIRLSRTALCVRSGDGCDSGSDDCQFMSPEVEFREHAADVSPYGRLAQVKTRGESDSWPTNCTRRDARDRATFSHECGRATERFAGEVNRGSSPFWVVYLIREFSERAGVITLLFPGAIV